MKTFFFLSLFNVTINSYKTKLSQPNSISNNSTLKRNSSTLTKPKLKSNKRSIEKSKLEDKKIKQTLKNNKNQQPPPIPPKNVKLQSPSSKNESNLDEMINLLNNLGVNSQESVSSASAKPQQISPLSYDYDSCIESGYLSSSTQGLENNQKRISQNTIHSRDSSSISFPNDSTLTKNSAETQQPSTFTSLSATNTTSSTSSSSSSSSSNLSTNQETYEKELLENSRTLRQNYSRINTYKKQVANYTNKFKNFLIIIYKICPEEFLTFNFNSKEKIIKLFPEFKNVFMDVSEIKNYKNKLEKNIMSKDLKNSAKDCLINKGWMKPNPTLVESSSSSASSSVTSSAGLATDSSSSGTASQDLNQSSASIQSDTNSEVNNNYLNNLTPQNVAKILTNIEMSYISLCDTSYLINSLKELSSVSSISEEDQTKSSHIDINNNTKPTSFFSKILGKNSVNSPVDFTNFNLNFETSPESNGVQELDSDDECHENIKNYINWCQRLEKLVITEILLSANLKSSQKILLFWLSVYKHCLSFGNFNSASNISLAINNTAIIRLYKKLFPSSYLDKKSNHEIKLIFNECQKFIHPNNNFYVYRNEYKMYKIQQKNCILIPSITILRKDLLSCKNKISEINILETLSNPNLNQVLTPDQNSVILEDKLSKLNDLSLQIKEYNLLQKSIFAFVKLNEHHSPNIFCNNVELLENHLILNGGVLNTERCRWYSYLFEGPKNSFEKNDYKKLKKIYKHESIKK